MEKDKNGRSYPSKSERVPNKKSQARLKARIRNWEALNAGPNNKQRIGYNDFQYTKPGSNNK